MGFRCVPPQCSEAVHCALSEMLPADGGRWVPVANGVPSERWWSVEWSPERAIFLASSADGGAMTSPDGFVWTARNTPYNNQWRSVVWSPQRSLFVVIGSCCGPGNRIMTSSAGTSFTLRSEPSNNQFVSATWSPQLGLFVAVSIWRHISGGRVMTSSNGVSWTIRSTPADLEWWGVTWSSDLGLFAAVSSTGSNFRVMTSSNGVSWTLRATPADLQWQNVVWVSGLGIFVAVARSGNGNQAMTSSNGLTWALQSTPPFAMAWFSVAWSEELGVLVATAASGTHPDRVMTSRDGSHWEMQPSPSGTWTGVTWSPELGIFVAVGTSGSHRVMVATPYCRAGTAQVGTTDHCIREECQNSTSQWRETCLSSYCSFGFFTLNGTCVVRLLFLLLQILLLFFEAGSWLFSTQHVRRLRVPEAWYKRVPPRVSLVQLGQCGHP